MFIPLAIVTATVAGIMVGVEFGVAVLINPVLVQLPAGAYLEAGARLGRLLGRVMPFWYIGSLILTVALVATAWGSSAAVVAVIAAALLLVSVVMSVTLLVPINNRSKNWTAEDHPDDWREQRRRWDRLHYVRVAVIVAAFVLLLVAAVTG